MLWNILQEYSPFYFPEGLKSKSHFVEVKQIKKDSEEVKANSRYFLFVVKNSKTERRIYGRNEKHR